ncbi:MAG: protein-L-isoaspartate(D-aspartate) O-methyltransferase [Nitrospinota bacterium]|nr:protein-L-isoaspartate(D-aspartate) O-methyltransferase [Nitrospinota bacterium]
MRNFLFKIFRHSPVCRYAALSCYFVIVSSFRKVLLSSSLPLKKTKRGIASSILLYGFATLSFVCFFQIHNLAYAEEPRFIKARERMVAKDLMGRDIKDPKVLDAMKQVKRHLFVDKHLQKVAYSDHPLPIGEGQTISQPYIVAMMTQILNVSPGEKVLEIGTGSGYQAAVLAKLTDNVFSIEIKKGLHEKAKERLIKLGYNTIKLKYGDGYFGWKDYAPFDAIIITAAANHIPPPLIKQLKTGGRLILPLGNTTSYQTLTLITKNEKDLNVRHITGVVFVPMTGKAQE